MKRVDRIPETEAEIQAKCEDWLLLKGMTFLRIPDAAYKNVGSCSWRDRKQIADYLKGWPDLMIWEPQEDCNRVLAIELKRKGGRLSQGQRKVHQRITASVCYSLEEFIETVEQFIKGERE